MSTEQEKLLVEVAGISDQIKKGHYLNVHFRAFELAYNSWREHVRQNAITGAKRCGSPMGAVMEPPTSLSADVSL
jgi:hypothetical protein